MEAGIFTLNQEKRGIHNGTRSRGEQLMSLHDSRSASPTESLVLGRAEAHKRCRFCPNTFHDTHGCQSREGKRGRLKATLANAETCCLVRILH